MSRVGQHFDTPSMHARELYEGQCDYDFVPEQEQEPMAQGVKVAVVEAVIDDYLAEIRYDGTYASGVDWTLLACQTAPFDHLDVTAAAESRFAPAEVRDRALAEVSERGGRLSYSGGAVSAKVVLGRLAELGVGIKPDAVVVALSLKPHGVHKRRLWDVGRYKPTLDFGRNKRAA